MFEAFIIYRLNTKNFKQKRFFLFVVTSRTIMYGEDHYFTRSSCENLKYVINKRRSILSYEQKEKANLKKKKGKKLTEEEKMQKVKEKEKAEESTVDDKEDIKTQNLHMPYKININQKANEVEGEYFTEVPLGNGTTGNQKSVKKRSNKSKDINGVIVTGLCCSII